MRTFAITLLLLATAAGAVRAQERVLSQQEILQRLTRLEEQNRTIMQEIEQLRQMLKTPDPSPAASPAADEKVEALSQRTADLDQTKVEAGQKLPISLTGMVLFNAFLNGRASGGSDYPVTASTTNGGRTSGGTITQSIIGFRFGPSQSFLGARVSANVDLDLWGGAAANNYGIVRLRTGVVQLDWRSTTLSVGQEKPLISPLNPTSFAQVAVPPLTGAGNLWYWQPQVRLEQRFHLGPQWQVKVQGALIQTNERYTNPYAHVERARPGLEGRVEIARSGDQPRWTFGISGHTSQSHVNDDSIDSRIFAVDGTARITSWLSAEGTYFTGRNVDVLGGSGVSISDSRNSYNPDYLAVRAHGGWLQLTPHITRLLDLNLFAGQERSNVRDLFTGQLQNNTAFGINAIYRIAPNVVLSWETSQTRTGYAYSFQRTNIHHDLAIAYLF